MSRRSSPITASIALLVVAAGAPIALAQGVDPHADPDSAIESYLEANGLRDLLVTQLESRLDRSRTAEKTRIVEQLAGLYAEMLEAAETSQERIALVEKGHALLLRAAKARGTADRGRVDVCTS